VRGAILHAAYYVRIENRDDPTIMEPTDAIIRLSATCVCGSDLWPYRGIEAVTEPCPIGHEYVGIVEAVGRDVRTIKPGEFVIARSSHRTTPVRTVVPGTRPHVSIGS
jgi:threonine dehydrogenase-like Zn-dependent dehydrogenase